MTCFVDSSALYAVLDKDDKFSSAAIPEWKRLNEKEINLVTTNYVVLETTALAQKRIGIRAVEVFQRRILPVISVHWIKDDVHITAVADLLLSKRRSISLVDWTSFTVMKSLGIKEVFTFDRHFSKQGFKVVP